MELAFKTRPFYPDEIRLLKTLRTQKVKESRHKIRYYHFVVAAIAGAGCTYVAAAIPDSSWTFLFGIIAVFAFAFIIFSPYEIYKLSKRNRDFLWQLDEVIQRGKVDTCVIHAKRIAVAKEFEDEEDLYIIEYDTDKLLYLWDHHYNLRKKFPCLDFEIYEDKFFKLFGRQIYPLSSRIKPITIDPKAKWNYMTKIGCRGHLETESKNLDLLVKEYNDCA